MSKKLRRRTVLKGLAAAGASAAIMRAPAVHAQAEPIRVGFLTVKTGQLASGGIQMDEGLTLYLKERDYTLAGRKVEVFTGDTAGVPATARTKLQEMVERNKVACLIGPLAAFEALALDDYIREAKLPTLSVAAAEDMTQRKANPWFVRATSTSAQCSHPMGEYAATVLKYKRVATIADDFAYGNELVAGFQRVFEDNGGKVVQKLWPPLAVPDYANYIAQIKPDVDAIFIGFAGSNGFRFIRQYNEYGGTIPIIGGMTAVDESLLKNMGAEALGLVSTCWYSAQLDNPSNAKLVEGMARDYKTDPGFYAAATYVNGAVLEAALTSIGGKAEDRDALIKALRATNIKESARGPVRFDEYGNVIGNVYIRRVERKNGKLVNAVIHTYADVSQFWKWTPQEFMANPVYSRDFPPARFLE
jgi:branched-chain amino acid transport system substrate-binding protein